MRRIVLRLAIAASLTGCVQGVSPAQRLYAAMGGYSVALTGAVTYAEQPAAVPAIVHRLRAAKDRAQPAYLFADAFRQCMAGVQAVRGAPCASFDFGRASLLDNATTLRNAALALQERGQ